MLIPFLFQILILPSFEVLAHSFILSIEGANGVRSAAFGSRLTLRGALQQNTGIIKEAEIAASTVGPCGRVFGGEHMDPFNIDLEHELSLAEASAIPTATQDGEISMGVFVHNSDGAGPYICDYSPDATLKAFEPMNITSQIEGVKGINPAAKDYVYPLKAGFFSNSTCTGGTGKDVCVMRCRNELGFGSCAAVKLGSPSFINTTSGNSSNLTSEWNYNGTLPTNQSVSTSAANTTLESLSNKTSFSGFNFSGSQATNATNSSQLDNLHPKDTLPDSSGPKNLTDFTPMNENDSNSDQLPAALEKIGTTQNNKDVGDSEKPVAGPQDTNGTNSSQLPKTHPTNILPNSNGSNNLTDSTPVNGIVLENSDQLLAALETIEKVKKNKDVTVGIEHETRSQDGSLNIRPIVILPETVLRTKSRLSRSLLLKKRGYSTKLEASKPEKSTLLRIRKYGLDY
ncbi:hypothetical protein CROQUDRAFT_60593 [Cronartium quercuum f. sp. fusiforme G11]|uniref:Uncharacterized protein n=1 Tax=Cronartium quercuum f. sp. fusiforme G11 TaxID=708437 RepID=A0A9P6NRU2_9BASI|nr:hypothetical protein CROQUDRAFT_60593 [Cronartium quercuum f. sp. fusiforme G11]